ncbi:interleukin-12 receptor subunit beta-2 [Elgaria multicarinata webbii]|uniref:interleukin-12 receptor subunit beta-2 n=1 Tax=Elgaria multicarinata webbii TaxID=159646 RepID=UPI002FCD54CD
MNVTGIYMLRGSTVTLSCWLNKSGWCSRQEAHKISILQNYSEVSSGNGLSVSTHVLLHRFGNQTFQCQCPKGKKTPVLICGIHIVVGIPPDQPKNVSCIQYGKNGHSTCSWDKGHYTYLTTNYRLQLTNGITNRTFSQEGISIGSMDLKEKLGFESTYTVVVIATNGLGNTSSQPIQFTLIDIAKPHSPVDLSVKCDSFAATNCTILWQDQQETQHFKLRYRPIHSNSWTMLENITTRRYDLHDLEPDREYEFQVSCRFLLNRGLWSDWSTAFQTEAVPFEPIDVWYLKEDVSSQMQNVTLFWKATHTSRRKSHNYSVTFFALNQKHHRAVETDSTTHTILSRVTPKTDYNITVHSYNSRGISSPIYITTKLGITDLPPPSHLSAASMKNGSIVIAWKAPLAPSPFINGYVVEWVELHQGHHLKTWLKVPASNFTVIIANLKPNVCYSISAFALYQSRAGKAAATVENVSAKAPLTGPHINATVRGEHILVSWEEIPGNQQVGCIVGYKIYLQNQYFTNVPLKVYDISTTDPQPFPIESIQPGNAYAIWMTASTTAGESPKGNEEAIYIQNAPDWGSIVICIIVGLSASVCCVPFARQKIVSFLSVLLFGWYGKAVPDPANSSWAKEFTSIKDDPNLYSTQNISNPNSFEEPETLQIEEVFVKRQHPAFEDGPLLKNTEKGESHNCLTTSSLQKENPTVKYLDYEPSITSTLVDTNKQQFLPLYRKIAAEEPHQGQVFSEYLANPFVDATVDYLTTITPTVMNTDGDSSETELSSLSVFPRTSFLPQTVPFGGKLTLDAVRMDCKSFTE